MANNKQFENWSIQKDLDQLLKIKQAPEFFIDRDNNRERPYAIKLLGNTYYWADEKTREADMHTLNEIRLAMARNKEFVKTSGVVKIDKDPYNTIKMYNAIFINIEMEDYPFSYCESVHSENNTRHLLKTVTWVDRTPPGAKKIEEEIKNNSILYFQG